MSVLRRSPNGLNINDNCGSTHVEALQAECSSSRPTLGIASMGDGDAC